MKVDHETVPVSLRQVVLWVQIAVLLGAPLLAQAQGITLPDTPRVTLQQVAAYFLTCVGAFITICFGIFAGKFSAGRAHWIEGIPAIVGGSLMIVAGMFIA
jgi:hypothetical protein